MTQEIITIINNIPITRTVGTKFPYYVTIREDKGFKEFASFKTCKSAKAFVASITQ